jgi:hypothetical protein
MMRDPLGELVSRRLEVALLPSEPSPAPVHPAPLAFARSTIEPAESYNEFARLSYRPLTSAPYTAGLAFKQATERKRPMTAAIAPIPGTRKLERLEENIGAAAIELTSNDLHEIESAASKIPVQAARYPEAPEQMTGR